jgi:hypothetical protein
VDVRCGGIINNILVWTTEVKGYLGVTGIYGNKTLKNL